ncbi:unnamed protein product [Albugo candida]|uniref:Uncharacterized protein n=1 Tax=Albugo candida TaxID=65357 RepID=A0A024GU43_9STRA|nr:unnamed protein product [Albugo candida]|eukprot:CCI50261.1 unnamed protein product [Albugo candida]
MISFIIQKPQHHTFLLRRQKSDHLNAIAWLIHVECADGRQLFREILHVREASRELSITEISTFCTKDWTLAIGTYRRLKPQYPDIDNECNDRSIRSWRLFLTIHGRERVLCVKADHLNAEYGTVRALKAHLFANFKIPELSQREARLRRLL